MRSHLLTLMVVSLFALPLVGADPGPGATPGLGTACGASENPQPCRGIIPDTNATTGNNKTYTGGWKATGTVIVYPGATVTVVDASITFENTSNGFIVLPGGTLTVTRSTLQESSADAPYQLVAQAGSNFTLNDSRVIGGEGVRVATAGPSITGSSLEGIPLALRLDGVTSRVHHNQFLNNTVAVNQTGGTPTLENNLFSGGETCIRDFQTDPTIRYNTFRGCHVGIFHEQSHSDLSYNDMMDQAAPPGAGMIVVGGLSPVIEGNTIRNYGTGILVVDARAYIRNNTISDNVGDGIRVESNAAPMDIQGNVVERNGGAGIRLVDVSDLPVFGNTVRNNTGSGIVVEASPGMTLTNNVVRNNGGNGISIGNMTGATVSGGEARGNGMHGLRLDHALDVSVSDVSSLSNGRDGVFIGASRATLLRVNASQNARNGFTYDPMGPFQLLGNTEMSFIRAIGNQVAGLHNIEGNTTSVTQGWFQGNVGAGVRNSDVTSAIDARDSYWGAASGPTTALNPFGTGDRIEGNVVFAPFRTTPP